MAAWRAQCQRITSSWSGPSYGGAGAPHVRHFLVHTRRAGHVVARPLNCGIMRLLEPSAFEAAVLQWIAARSRDEALELQLAGVTVAERDYTVAGCYSKLVVAGAPCS